MCLPSDPRYGGHDCKHSWQTCVSSYRLCIKWPGYPTMVVDIGCPPIPVMTTAADMLFNGLHYHPALEPLVDKIDAIRRHVLSFTLCVRDIGLCSPVSVAR
jgi:hypothetical protein